MTVRLLLRAAGLPLAWIAFFSCFLNISYLAAPIYMMQVYDRVLHSQSLPTLLYLTLAVAVAYTLFAILDGVRGQILAGISDIIEGTLAPRLLHHAMAPVERTGKRPGAVHLGRDLDTVRQFGAGSAILSIIDAPWAPLYLVVLFKLHWVLGVFALISCAILVILTFASERAVRGPMQQAGLVSSRAYQFGDAISRHADCASSMDLERGLTSRWRALRSRMLDAQNVASQRAVVFAALAKFVKMFMQSAILGLGAFLAINHTISGGAIFAASLLLGRCLAPIEALIGHWRGTISATDALGRIAQVVGPLQTSNLVLPDPKGELSAEQVTWTPRDSNRPVLIDVSLRIEPGAVLAIVGPNSAGKSTLGRLMAGALVPDQGFVRLDGGEFSAWNASQRGRAIGYLPQDVSLFPGTIRDNIARFGDASDSEVVEAAQCALAHEMILRLPFGYQTVLDPDSAGLSGGQRQRIALARALLFDPPVLVLDEPNASLDADGEAALFRCIITARERHKTVVLITHSTALVRLADHVATMVGGRIMRLQPTAEFLGRPKTAAIAG